MRLVSFIDLDERAIVINPDHLVSLREGILQGTIAALSDGTEKFLKQPLDEVVATFLGIFAVKE